MTQTVRTKGLREFIAKADAAGRDTKRAVRDGLREAAEPVKQAVQAKLSAYDASTAARVGVSVRRAGTVAVEQRHRKVTGLRGDYGALQMRAGFVPGLEENRNGVQARLELVTAQLIRDHGL